MLLFYVRRVFSLISKETTGNVADGGKKLARRVQHSADMYVNARRKAEAHWLVYGRFYYFECCRCPIFFKIVYLTDSQAFFCFATNFKKNKRGGMSQIMGKLIQQYKLKGDYVACLRPFPIS